MMTETLKEMMDKVDTSALITRSLSDWRIVLAEECQVYVFNENYIAKRFDQINFKFCNKSEAKEILVDNLYALLRFKYFPKVSEEIDNRIDQIVRSFTANLKTTLLRVSFNEDSNCKHISLLPNYCCAFRNGVYNFKDDTWLFRYNVVKIESLKNSIYLYDNTYAILWYLDFDFEPLPIGLKDTSFDEFIELMKSTTKDERNYCFELMYNIAHDGTDMFDKKRFMHLCEVMGYTILQSMSQHFVLLIGSGGNGKNSLFDGCFSDRVVPSPAANDLSTIETNNFITGALENKYQNIFLETSTKEDTYKESMMIKGLTGSTTQTINHKGVDGYTGFINCKYIFSANDQDRIKFTDTTIGFTRRINVFEIWYHWDASKRFLKHGDYYDTTFSDDLHEIKDNLMNATIFVYFAMYGIKNATKNFVENFKFSRNDWKMTYTDIDFDLKDEIENVSNTSIVRYIKANKEHYNESKSLFYDVDGVRLYTSNTMLELGYSGYDDMIKMLNDDETFVRYFADNDVYMNVRLLQQICGDLQTPTSFTQSLKKLYGLSQLKLIYMNKPYVKVTFINKKLKVVK